VSIVTDELKHRPAVESDSASAATLRHQRLVALILYLPFGIVRGQILAADPAAAAAALSGTQGMVEIRQANVEHYSNHLPTGRYSSLFVNLQQISGFSITDELCS
jgi:hypothetical protein